MAVDAVAGAASAIVGDARLEIEEPQTKASEEENQERREEGELFCKLIPTVNLHEMKSSSSRKQIRCHRSCI